MILAIVDDLIFRAKLQAAAAQRGSPLTVVKDPSEALRSGQSWSRVLIDLNLSQGDPLTMIRQIRHVDATVSIIGYCSHVQQELQQQALEAGCTTVLPRSVFVQQLPQLLKESRCIF